MNKDLEITQLRAALNEIVEIANAERYKLPGIAADLVNVAKRALAGGAGDTPAPSAPDSATAAPDGSDSAVVRLLRDENAKLNRHIQLAMLICGYDDLDEWAEDGYHSRVSNNG